MIYNCYLSTDFCWIISNIFVPFLACTSLLANAFTLFILLQIQLPISQHLPFQFLVISEILSSLCILATFLVSHFGVIIHEAFYSLTAFMLLTIVAGGWCQNKIPLHFRYASSLVVQHGWFIVCCLITLIPQSVVGCYIEYDSSTGMWNTDKNYTYNIGAMRIFDRVLPIIGIIFFLILLAIDKFHDDLRLISLIQAVSASYLVSTLPFFLDFFVPETSESHFYYSSKLFVEMIYLHMNFIFFYVFYDDFKNKIKERISSLKRRIRNKESNNSYAPDEPKSSNNSLLNNIESGV